MFMGINDRMIEKQEQLYNGFGSKVRSLSDSLKHFAEPYKMDIYRELNIKPPQKGEENSDTHYFYDFMFFAGAMLRKNLIVIEILEKSPYDFDSPDKVFFDALAECSDIPKIRRIEFNKRIEIGKAFFNRGIDFMDDRLHDAVTNLTGGTHGKIL